MPFFAIATVAVHASETDDTLVVEGGRVSPPLPSFDDAAFVLGQVPPDPRVRLVVVEAEAGGDAGYAAFHAEKGVILPNVSVTVIRERTEPQPVAYGDDPFPWGYLIAQARPRSAGGTPQSEQPAP